MEKHGCTLFALYCLPTIWPYRGKRSQPESLNPPFCVNMFHICCIWTHVLIYDVSLHYMIIFCRIVHSDDLDMYSCYVMKRVYLHVNIINFARDTNMKK